MPIIPKFRRPEPTEAAKPQSLAAAYSIRRSVASKRPAQAMPQEEVEAPAASIAEAVMRRRKAALAPPADPMEAEDDSLFDDQDMDAEAAADVEEAPEAESFEGMDMIDQIRAKRKAARGL